MKSVTRKAAQVKASSKPARSLRLVSFLDAAGRGVLEITQGKVRDVYDLQLIEGATLGLGVQVSKRGEPDSTYAVLLAGDASTCECRGHLQHGHKTRCRHIAALLICQGKGWLDVPKKAPRGWMMGA